MNFGGNVDLNSVAKSLGVDPSALAGLDPATIQKLAQANDTAGTSTEAQLEQANTTAVRGIKNALNARGLLNSGETGYQLGQQQQSYTQAQYDARQKLTDYMTQYQQGYLTAQQQIQQQLASSASSAADRQYANNQGSAGFQALFDHVDPSGVAVYKGADGNLYRSDGTIYTAPSASGGGYNASAGLATPQTGNAPSAVSRLQAFAS